MKNLYFFHQLPFVSIISKNIKNIEYYNYFPVLMSKTLLPYNKPHFPYHRQLNYTLLSIHAAQHTRIHLHKQKLIYKPNLLLYQKYFSSQENFKVFIFLKKKKKKK